MGNDNLTFYRCYEHYKGGIYFLIAQGKLESLGEESEEYCVYKSAKDEQVWIRPLAEFKEKFKPIQQILE